MDDIRRRDLKVLFVEILGFRCVASILFVGFLAWLISSNPFGSPIWTFPVAGGLIGYALFTAFQRSIPKRFHHERFRYLWKECNQRHEKLRAALQKSRKNKFAELSELERTVDRTMPDIYRAIRRADLVLREIQQSEALVSPRSIAHERTVDDSQAQELYKVADRNIAEYTQHFKQAIGGVERAEAQAVVFSTTLDTLRIRLLNYSLSGRSPEAETKEFLNIVAEAKMQFASIDKALDEIELMPFTETIHTLRSESDSPRPQLEQPQSPPPIPDQARQKIDNSEQ